MHRDFNRSRDVGLLYNNVNLTLFQSFCFCYVLIHWALLSADFLYGVALIPVSSNMYDAHEKYSVLNALALKEQKNIA